MANTRDIWQQAAHTTYQLLSLCCSTRAKQNKTITSQGNKYAIHSWGKVRRMDHQQEMTTQKEQEEWTGKQEIGKENRTTALRSQKGGRFSIREKL